MTDAVSAILRMTLLRLAMVPPPMALHEIHLPEVVLDSAVDRTNTIFALLHPQSVSVFRSSNKASVSSAIELQFTHELSQDRFRGTPIQVSFDEQDHIYVLFDGEDKTILDVATLELARIHGSTINRLITSVANSGMGLIEDNTITQLLPRAFSPPSMVTDRPGSGDRKLICRFPSVAPAATFLYHEDQVSSGKHDYLLRSIDFCARQLQSAFQRLVFCMRTRDSLRDRAPHSWSLKPT